MPTKDYEKPDKSKRTYQKDAEFNDAQEEKLEIEKVGQSNLLQNSEKRQSKELSALLDQLEPSLDASAVQEGLKSKSMQATEEGMRGANYEAQQSQGKNQQYEANQSANQGFDLSGLQSGGNPGQTSDLKTGAAGEMFSQSALSRPSKTLQTVKPLNLQANPSTQSQNFQSLFEKSIQIALERTCVGGNTVRSLTSVEMVGTLPVDSPDLHGYLVVSVSGLTADGHLEFINKFRQVLAALFIELGLTAQVEDGFVVLQESFEFLEWAKQESALCMTTQHLDHSVGVAFLPTEDRFGDLPRESGKPDLALVSVKTIDTEKPIPFKAYLHFKRSDRLYLYLRNGRRLFPEQKNRLLDHKVSDFYIKSVDVKNYKTYSAANYIGQSFRRTKNRRAS